MKVARITGYYNSLVMCNNIQSTLLGPLLGLCHNLYLDSEDHSYLTNDFILTKSDWHNYAFIQ